jgi:hypothetical protein
MVSIVNKNLLRKQRIAVASEGDLVVMTLGNVEVKLPYETAFLLSQWLRVRAKEGKRRAGDTGRHWSLLGTLHDASMR